MNKHDDDEDHPRCDDRLTFDAGDHASPMEVTPSWARMAKTLPGGRVALVVRMLFTFRLTVGSAASMSVGCYDDGWCYHTERAAIAALTRWDGTGEPTGWHRHPRSGRRRPEGDAAREYVNP